MSYWEEVFLILWAMYQVDHLVDSVRIWAQGRS